MRLFSALFHIAKLPVLVAKDTITLLPDLSNGEAFESTREQAGRIDDALQGKEPRP